MGVVVDVVGKKKSGSFDWIAKSVGRSSFHRRKSLCPTLPSRAVSPVNGRCTFDCGGSRRGGRRLSMESPTALDIQYYSISVVFLRDCCSVQYY